MKEENLQSKGKLDLIKGVIHLSGSPDSNSGESMLARISFTSRTIALKFCHHSQVIWLTALPNNYEELEPVDENIVRSLMQMFDEHNRIAKYFRMVRDRFIETNFSPVRLRLIGDRSSEFSSPAAFEIADPFADVVGPNAEDKPDVVSRVFKLKLWCLMDDIKKGKLFGPVIADIVAQVTTITLPGHRGDGARAPPRIVLDLKDGRYKVEVTVTDETEIATFLLFGSSAEKLLKLPSEKIKSPSFASTNNVPAYILKQVIDLDKVFGVSPTTRNIPCVGENLIFKVKHITDINEGDNTQQNLSITTQIDAIYSQETPQSKKHVILTPASIVISKKFMVSAKGKEKVVLAAYVDEFN
ncbi:hypothetical protein Cni_G14360 [Canna indica]|uniref:Uncharacterized protein n=1 Tax=Canna indica TaxID=4628 RepID=A0AAQ3QAL6_9LILI|nr:hypothetical protein Cni_G14360 [Canna indica]